MENCETCIHNCRTANQYPCRSCVHAKDEHGANYFMYDPELEPKPAEPEPAQEVSVIDQAFEDMIKEQDKDIEALKKRVNILYEMHNMPISKDYE